MFPLAPIHKGCLKLRGHGNKFHAMATKNTICCNRIKMFSCVPMLNFTRLQHFWPMFLLQQQKKKSNRFDFFFFYVSETNFHGSCCKIMRVVNKSSCPHTLSRIFATYFFLTNRIPLHNSKKSKKSFLSHAYKIKMAENQQVQPNFVS